MQFLFRSGSAIAQAALLLCLAGNAFGAGITLNISNPFQSGAAGQNFQFQGTISNTTPDSFDESTLFLVFSGYDPLNLPAFNDQLGLTPFTLLSGQTTSTLNLFDVTADAAAAPGVYEFFASLQNLSGEDVSDAVRGTITIEAVPEPSTIALLAGGAILFGLRRKYQGGRA
jgi:hypothetical protein